MVVEGHHLQLIGVVAMGAGVHHVMGFLSILNIEVPP